MMSADCLVLLSDVHAQPLVALGQSDMLDDIGDDHIFGNIDDALAQARVHLGLPVIPAPPFAKPTVARETPVRGVPSYRPPGEPTAGVVSRAEAEGNADLVREFHVVDVDNNARLSRVELKDWIDPLTLD